LPGDAAGSNEVLDFIAKDISPLTYVNLMDQYYPGTGLKTLRHWIVRSSGVSTVGCSTWLNGTACVAWTSIANGGGWGSEGSMSARLRKIA
jgi:hypothetical protein